MKADPAGVLTGMHYLDGDKACAEEISWSRVYGGIHYLFSGEDGLASGKKVAEAVYLASKE